MFSSRTNSIMRIQPLNWPNWVAVGCSTLAVTVAFVALASFSLYQAGLEDHQKPRPILWAVGGVCIFIALCIAGTGTFKVYSLRRSLHNGERVPLI